MLLTEVRQHGELVEDGANEREREDLGVGALDSGDDPLEAVHRSEDVSERHSEAIGGDFVLSGETSRLEVLVLKLGEIVKSAGAQAPDLAEQLEEFEAALRDCSLQVDAEEER